jgi:hypothetical protein
VAERRPELWEGHSLPGSVVRQFWHCCGWRLQRASVPARLTQESAVAAARIIRSISAIVLPQITHRASSSCRQRERCKGGSNWRRSTSLYTKSQLLRLVNTTTR